MKPITCATLDPSLTLAGEAIGRTIDIHVLQHGEKVPPFILPLTLLPHHIDALWEDQPISIFDVHLIPNGREIEILFGPDVVVGVDRDAFHGFLLRIEASR